MFITYRDQKEKDKVEFKLMGLENWKSGDTIHRNRDYRRGCVKCFIFQGGEVSIGPANKVCKLKNLNYWASLVAQQ